MCDTPARALLALAFLSGACPAPSPGTDTASGEPTTRSLLDNDLWQAVGGDADPYAASRQGDATVCPEATYGTEYQPDGAWWTVETKTCAYATFQSPLQADLPLGALVTVRIWHFALTAGEGDFTVTLAVGGDTLYQTTLPVPSESGLLYEQFGSPVAAKAGDPLYFHLSNHGDNSWSLIELSASY